MRSKRYRELHKLDWSPNWVFRKYSSEKRKEFVASTGILAEEKNAAAAYKKGAELFDVWLGSHMPSGRRVLIKDLGRAVLSSKESKKGGKAGAQYRSVKNAVLNHINPNFGHLEPKQMTSLRWEKYDAEERQRVRIRILKDGTRQTLPPRKALENTRKVLAEIMRRAYEEGYIKRVPVLKNNDPEAAPAKYLERREIRRFLHAASRNTKLLAFIMWKQGPRPSEACQYRFSQIDFGDGEHGSMTIPGAITKNGKTRTIPLNSRVSRVLRSLKKRTPTDCLFPSPGDPNQPIAEYKTGFETAFRKAKLIGFVPYNFRDTAINDMLRRGLSTVYIAKYVQNSAAIIEKKYAVASRDVMERVAG